MQAYWGFFIKGTGSELGKYRVKCGISYDETTVTYEVSVLPISYQDMI